MPDPILVVNNINNIWKTGISQAFWCHASEKECNLEAFEPAVDLDLTGEEKNLSWFDRMLGGGIVLPETSYNPLTILLTGPPGSGKTTFALEFAYRLINNKIDINNNHIENNALTLNLDPPKKCLYISIESTSEQILNKVRNFKWNNFESIFCKYQDNRKEKAPSNERVILYGVENIKGNNIKKITIKAIDAINEGKKKLNILVNNFAFWFFIFGLSTSLTPIPKDIRNFIIIPSIILLSSIFILIPPLLKKINANLKKSEPTRDINFLRFAQPIMNFFSDDIIDILVIDSLNSLQDEKSKGRTFTKFLNSIHGKAKVVLFLLDSDKRPSQSKFWEYICDTVIRLDSETQSGYWLRTIEIEKARYQKHIQGKQILKIEPGIDSSKKLIPCYSHPYRLEGGLFVFPSIHYYLSYYKKHLSEGENDSELSREQEYAKLYPYSLNELIKNDSGRGLIPIGRCTAFVGHRGGHKSHLGYMFLLHQMIDMQESALVVSLRDDKKMTRKAMITILNQEEELLEKAKEQEHLTNKNTEEIIRWFEENGRLEILYFHPGYITPEEFCHRMLMSAQHIKYDGLTHNQCEGSKRNHLPKGNWEKLTVLFNSLDQLTSRFPLCTKQDIFVPGLIDTLTGEDVTSIFVAVNTDDQPDDQYGLMSMADLILSFKPCTFKLDEYYRQLLLSCNNISNITIENSKSEWETVEIEIKRFAGGEKAGAKGTLELINDKNSPLYQIFKKTGLRFNQIYKNTDKRKSKRKKTNLKAIFELENFPQSENPISIDLLNISEDGMCFSSKSNQIVNYLQNHMNISLRSHKETEPVSGQIKWLRMENDNIKAGLKSNRVIDIAVYN